MDRRGLKSLLCGRRGRPSPQPRAAAAGVTISWAGADITRKYSIRGKKGHLDDNDTVGRPVGGTGLAG